MSWRSGVGASKKAEWDVRAVLTAVLGAALILVGGPARAEEARPPLQLEGPTAADFERLVWLIANDPQPLSIEARKELKDIQKHVAADDRAGTAGAYVICQAAMALHDRDALEGCTATLRRSAPQDPRTISSQWALAMERGDHDDARRLIARARTAGVPAKGLAAMETATRSIGPVRLFRAATWALLEAAIFLLALSGSRPRFQRRQLGK